MVHGVSRVASHEHIRDESEEAANNNHGTWYDVQAMRYAVFLGNKTLAVQLAEAAKTRRIAAQINPDGSEPQELARTNSLFYSEYDLTGLFNVAQLAGDVGVDLSGMRRPMGGVFSKALDFLALCGLEESLALPRAQAGRVHTLSSLCSGEGVSHTRQSPTSRPSKFDYAALLSAHIVQLVYPK